jgi:RNA recognition motif-containing protein
MLISASNLKHVLVNFLAGLREVIIYSNLDESKQNRGFCFLEYYSHREAILAKKHLSIPVHAKMMGCDILVDWADHLEVPDEETMKKVKVLYVRRIAPSVTEDMLKTLFGIYGVVEHVKKIKVRNAEIHSYMEQHFQVFEFKIRCS